MRRSRTSYGSVHSLQPPVSNVKQAEHFIGFLDIYCLGWDGCMVWAHRVRREEYHVYVFLGVVYPHPRAPYISVFHFGLSC